MRFYFLPLCLVLVAAACLPGYSSIPSFRGYTGLMIVPSADALGRGEWNAGIFFEDVASGTVNDIVANYGISQGFEVGINRFKRDDDSDDHTLINAKYRFMPETSSRPAFAAGIADAIDEIDTTVYIVASKSFGCAIRTWEGETLSPRFHVGLGGGALSGIFGGVSAYVGNRIEVMGEWDGDKVNAGARWRVTPQFTVHAGGFNLNDEEDEFSEGISFGLGASFTTIY